MIPNVPLDDDFGDWATPKDSTAGRFFCSPLSQSERQTMQDFSSLDPATAQPTPFPLFRSWLEQAVAAQLPEPFAMALATASADGSPSARMVLLRGYSEHGFDFYTNYHSRKGNELAQNPRAALVFYWAPLDMQIRIEGRVDKLSAAESDAYFRLRPLGHQLGAVASPQSRVIPDRHFLEARLAELLQKLGGQQDVPRPPHWGGYRVIPHTIEFWRGSDNRLHDRLRYRRQEDGSWEIDRLAP